MGTDDLTTANAKSTWELGSRDTIAASVAIGSGITGSTGSISGNNIYLFVSSICIIFPPPPCNDALQSLPYLSIYLFPPLSLCFALYLPLFVSVFNAFRFSGSDFTASHLAVKTILRTICVHYGIPYDFG